ncbi:MAG TPA: type II secretion system minor pseudopilin GspH [Casimicrobiaceae bacterium]|nr:type II secretion system minor pseudopilin GspH [Casimicrobiaceae bacterium]
MGPLARHRGFTLVEILVVLAILAIAASLAVLAYNGSDRDRAMREARRFAGALEHAAARAQTHAETLGASADGAAWRFWRRDRDSGRWQPLGDDEVLAAHALPDAMTIVPTSYSGRPVDPGVIVPLRATGRNEPFTFELDARDARLVLAADPLNRVAVVAAEQ